MKEITIYAPANELLENIVNEIAEKISCFIAIEPIELGFVEVTFYCDEEDAEYVKATLTALALLS